MNKKLLTILLCLAVSFIFNNQSNAQGTLLYFWNFNSWTPLYTSATPVSGTVGGLGIYAAIPADYARADLSTTNAMWVDRTIPGTSSAYSTYADFGTDPSDTINALVVGGVPTTPGNCFKARNPDDSMELLIYAPTTHWANIQITYGCQLSSYTSGDSINVFSYSVDSGTTWIMSGSGLDHWIDSGSVAFKLVSVHVNDAAAFNNSKFVFRIRLAGRNTGGTGNNRFDNVAVKGDTVNPTLGVTQLGTNEPVYTVYPNPAREVINVISNMGGDKSVIITNVIGQTVITETENGRNFSVNTSRLVSGAYYMTIRENETGNTKTLKFIIQ